MLTLAQKFSHLWQDPLRREVDRADVRAVDHRAAEPVASHWVRLAANPIGHALAFQASRLSRCCDYLSALYATLYIVECNYVYCCSSRCCATR